jgi:hypothetical protein
VQRNFLPLIDVGLFTSIDNPPEPFWNRGTVQFALAGLICFALSRWLFTLDSSTVLLLTSVFRLCPLLLIAKSRSAWPIAFATPYPFDLTLTAYSERGRWLPEDMAMNISGPTAFLILIGGTMFLSIPLSSWLISRSVKTSISEPLRHLGGWLFGITALAVILPIPQWSVFIIRNFAEPVALAGFAAVFGYGIRRR